MVKVYLVISFFMFIGCSTNHAFIKDRSQPKQSLKINSVQILHKGAYSGNIASDETSDFCKNFTLDESQVIEFFITANLVNLEDYEHNLIASNCYMDGTFVLDDGTTGNWKIDRSRRGFLYSHDGKAHYYYCNQCENELYYQSCDINCTYH